MSCVDCTRPLMSAWRYQALTPERRREVRAQGVREHRARQLCPACYWRRRKQGALQDAERITLRRDELVAEWDLFTKDRPTYRQNVKAFAEHLGRNYKSVEKALSRAGIGPNRIYLEAS